MKQTHLDITTRDGTCPAELFTDLEGDEQLPGVLLFMDAIGIRDDLYIIAERIAGSGYAVLVPDLFYRHIPYGPLDADAAFANEETRKGIQQRGGALVGEALRGDLGAYLAALEARPEVEYVVGATGYCMGGRLALNLAAYFPDRVRAVASFHGGGLASDKPDSPHLQAKSIKARVYVGAPAVDNAFNAADAGKLTTALREAGVVFTLETYPNAKHGFAVPGSSVFDQDAAERHYGRLFELFDGAAFAGGA